MVFCPHCKKEYDKNDDCCPICGHPEDCECNELDNDVVKDDYDDDADDDDG